MSEEVVRSADGKGAGPDEAGPVLCRRCRELQCSTETLVFISTC